MRGTNATVDGKGRLWIAVYSGIYLFDPGSGGLGSLSRCPRDQNLLPKRKAPNAPIATAMV
ncbi:MAG: hypothetical protein IPO05_10355 [Flavobacteriales bacterium]|nr:hypothetical protein [Flavobacteriales bacterium]